MEERDEHKLLSPTDQMELEVYEALKQVIDPEVGINIIDMGLVYTINYGIKEGIRIEMTLTSKGCPLGQSIMEAVTQTLQTAFPGIKNEVSLVWEPAWHISNISAAGMKQLGN